MAPPGPPSQGPPLFPPLHGLPETSPETRFLPEALPKPSLRAWPSSVVPSGSSVTLRCGTPTRDVSFALRKAGSVWEMVQSPDSTEGQAEFHLPDVKSSHAGQYTCEYHRRGDPHASSGPSDALLLLVTGEGAPGKDRQPPGPGAEGGTDEEAEREGRWRETGTEVMPWFDPGLLGGKNLLVGVRQKEQEVIGTSHKKPLPGEQGKRGTQGSPLRDLRVPLLSQGISVNLPSKPTEAAQ